MTVLRGSPKQHLPAAQMRCSVNVAVWTPEGRRCLTGTQAGEFTLWNGSQFSFETILQARRSLLLALTWGMRSLLRTFHKR